MYPSSLSVKTISLPVPIEIRICPDSVESQNTLVVGDSHGAFGNLLNYAHILLQNIDIPEKVAEILNMIAQSSCIDQMEKAFLDCIALTKERKKLEKGFADSQKIRQAMIAEDQAEKHYIFLHRIVRQEKALFDKICSQIMVYKRNDPPLFSLGDDVSDRNYCDTYAIKISTLIGMRKILSNHGLVLLYTWVNNDWDIDKPQGHNILSKKCTRSLNNFKILYVHKIISTEERDSLLKDWGKTLDLIMYSKQENALEIHVNLYVHAPGRFKRIFGLAKFYGILYPDLKKMRIYDLLNLMNAIMGRFKQSLEKFCSENEQTVELGREELKEFLTKTLLDKGTNPSEVYKLLFMRSEEYIKQDYEEDQKIMQSLIDNEKKHGKTLFIYSNYGHDLPAQGMPPDMIGLDNEYWKPSRPMPTYCMISKVQEITQQEVFDSETELEGNIIYYYNPPSESYIQFKLISNKGFFEDPTCNKGKSAQNIQYIPCIYTDRYFSGILDKTTLGNVPEDKIIDAVLAKTKSSVSLLQEYQPGMKTTHPVTIVTTSQQFPIYKKGEYVFPKFFLNSKNYSNSFFSPSSSAEADDEGEILRNLFNMK